MRVRARGMRCKEPRTSEINVQGSHNDIHGTSARDLPEAALTLRYAFRSRGQGGIIKISKSRTNRTHIHTCRTEYYTVHSCAKDRP